MRIAIVKLSALGDIVHAMVVLQFIKSFDSQISIDWIVEDSFKDILSNHPHIDQVYVVNLKNAKQKKSIICLFKELTKIKKLNHYDLVIDLQGLIKSALIARLVSSDKTFGFDKFSIREKFASFFYSNTFNLAYSKNVVERNISLICFALGLKVDKEQIKNKLPFLHSSSSSLGMISSNGKKNIILISGGSKKSKLYPAEKFAELSSLIDANFYITWGNEKEKMIAKEVKSLSPKVNILNDNSLLTLVSLISQSNLIIGADTGPTHMAWALNIPSITLYGSTPGYRNSYVTDINKIIESHSIVDPLKINHKDYSIREIDVNQISSVAKEILYLT